MWRYLEYMTATAKVASDKIYDYGAYYLNMYHTNSSEDDKDDQDLEIEDSIADYNAVIQVEKYIAGEKAGTKRILPPSGLYLEYSTFFEGPTHIIDNIYLGSAFNAATKNTLKDLNIKVIINVSKEITNYFDDEFIYHQYDLYDNNEHSILKHLIEAYKQIRYHQQHTEGNILIHCFMGASRSASVVLYYLMKHKKHDDGHIYSFDDALNFIRSMRVIVNPTFRLTKDLAKANMIE